MFLLPLFQPTKRTFFILRRQPRCRSEDLENPHWPGLRVRCSWFFPGGNAEILSLSHPQRLGIGTDESGGFKPHLEFPNTGSSCPIQPPQSRCKSAHQNIYWEGIDIFRGHNRKLKCGKMAVNSPFPGWEILRLGNTELNVGQILLGMDTHKERKERARKAPWSSVPLLSPRSMFGTLRAGCKR